MQRESDYEWLTQMGLCHRCRKERCAPGRKYCFDCLDKIREYNAKRYDLGKAKEYYARRQELYKQKKENGICVKCSKPATHGIYCYECSIKAKRHNIKIAEKRKAERHARGLIPEIRELNGLCLKCGRKLKETEVKYCDECTNKMKINLDKGRGKSPFRAMAQIRYKKNEAWREVHNND